MSQTLTLEPHSIKSPQGPFNPEENPASLDRLVDNINDSQFVLSSSDLNGKKLSHFRFHLVLPFVICSTKQSTTTIPMSKGNDFIFCHTSDHPKFD